MKTNQNETKSQAVEQHKERTGFSASTMPVLSKSGEFVHFFLPGDIVITEYANHLDAATCGLSRALQSQRDFRGGARR